MRNVYKYRVLPATTSWYFLITRSRNIAVYSGHQIGSKVDESILEKRNKIQSRDKRSAAQEHCNEWSHFGVLSIESKLENFVYRPTFHSGS